MVGRMRRHYLSSLKRGAPCAANEDDPMTTAHTTPVKLSLLARIEAKPGKEAEVEAFLKAGQALVEEEPGTTAWFAVQMGGGQFGIFDVFPDGDGRQAHLNGKVAAALMDNAADLFANAPQIHQIDVVAEKL